MESQPDMLMVYILFVVAAAFAAMFYFFRRKNAPHPLEQGKTPLYRETTGGIIGMVRYSFPFLRLSVYEDLIVIGAVKTIAFSLGDISKIETGRFLLSQGIRIHHNRADVPKKIVVWTGSVERIKYLLAGKVLFE